MSLKCFTGLNLKLDNEICYLFQSIIKAPASSDGGDVMLISLIKVNYSIITVELMPINILSVVSCKRIIYLTLRITLVNINYK